jgi:DNA sulfur modification protein DndD
MFLKTLELNNFRQFYGQHTIEFSTDPDKNVTLIHAENGIGKTAILNSILWCLYNKTTSNFEKKKDIQNHHSLDLAEKKYSVHITFVENGGTYVAQRFFENSKQTVVFRILKVSEHGNHSQIQDAEQFINSIIPKDMADYFFFKGEGADGFAINEASDVRAAVRKILGFTVAEAVLTDLDKVKSEYRKEQVRLGKGSDLSKIQESLRIAESELGDEDEKKKAHDQERQNLAKRYKTLQDEIKNSGNAEASRNAEEKEQVKKDLDVLDIARKSLLTRKAGLVAKYAVSAFSVKAVQKGIAFITDKELKGTIPAPFNKALVLQICNDELCICGATIKPGTAAYIKIQEQLGSAADPKLTNRVSRARGQLTVVGRDLQDAENEFHGIITELVNNETAIVSKKSRFETLSLALKGIDTRDIGKKESQSVTLIAQVQAENVAFGATESRMTGINDIISSLKSEERQFESMEPAIENLRKQIAFIELLEAELKRKLNESEHSSLKLLAEKINDFLALYAKRDYQVKLTGDFDIVLINTVDGREVPKSDGEKLLLGLTFISSLIFLAKQRSGATGQVLTPGTVAPFVIDAPFGDLDPSYRRSVANELPKSVNQIVLLLSSAHWKGEVEESIRARIGKEYNLVSEVVSDQGDKQSEAITILGNQYDTVRYSSEFPTTVVEVIAS